MDFNARDAEDIRVGDSSSAPYCDAPAMRPHEKYNAITGICARPVGRRHADGSVPREVIHGHSRAVGWNGWRSPNWI